MRGGPSLLFRGSDPLPLSASVRAEIRTDGPTMSDWAGYADLTLYAALSAFNVGDIGKANSLYADALKMWDGVGFAYELGR